MANPTLSKKIIIEGEIIAESGIMVGASSGALEIGGTDKQVVRNPINKMPYIPGSSLKGKMRSLIELNDGQMSENNGVYGPTLNPEHLAAQLFGFIKDSKLPKEKQSQQPSRLIVRDGEMTNSDKFQNTELLYTEVKAENSIDRVTSAANPRFFERVPKGARFKLNMTLNIFDTDKNKDKFLDTVFRAMRLVQDDYLGGGGSRGNGQISFEIKNIWERDKAYYEGDKSKQQSLNAQIPADLK
ncbi:MAG: type III-A CRISPR-associated RAMP protein Csm3 [Haliscomenobacteraceae bacterium CHB4]|nr:type III-A CRISPR-associated RAMP protein Csm3 [Haliscomenobacteraceae bacterium CHB4]